MTKNVTIKIQTNEAEVNLKLIKLFCKMIQATVDKNINYLKAQLLPTATLQHMSGYQQSTQEWFDYMQNGTMNYFANDVLNYQIKTSKQEYEFIADMFLKADVYHSGSHNWHMQMSFYFDQDFKIIKIVTKGLLVDRNLPKQLNLSVFWHFWFYFQICFINVKNFTKYIFNNYFSYKK